MIIQDKNKSLAKVCKDLMLKQPFYGIYLLMLDKKFSTTIPTACVRKLGINYQLLFGEKFWNSLTHEWKIGIVHHELLHLCFFHLLRHSEFENQEMANLAMDMEINQYIDIPYLPAKNMNREDFKTKYDPIAKDLVTKLLAGEITKAEYQEQILQIPPRGVYIEDYTEMNLETKKGTRYYYDKFMEAQKEKQQSAGRGEKSESGGEGTSGCDATDEILEQMEKNIPVPCDHDWKEFDGLSDTEKKLLGSQIDHHLKEIATSLKNRGTVPGEMKEYVDSLFVVTPPKFNWKAYLRRFFGGSYKTYTVLQRRKPNKRFEDNPGIKVKDRNHILVGIDTSGSVSSNELEEFLNEIHHIFKAGTDVTICQFDSNIQSIETFNPKAEFIFQGRGGTDFSPVVEYANANIRKYTSLCVFTDGEAPAPEKCRIPTLWVHSEQSSINDQLIGQKIRLEL